MLWLAALIFGFGFLKTSKKGITAGNTMRPCEASGCGHYLASRGDRPHIGIDLIVYPGEQIRTPISGVVTRHPVPYSGDIYRGIEIKGDNFTVKMFYLLPSAPIGKHVKAGEAIGTAQSISQRYTAPMTDHVHVEYYDKNGVNIDPTPMLL